MRELSLNILDIAQNSVGAGAKTITISVIAKANLLTVTVEDDGKGMTAEFLAKVTDPFTTSRTTRKVGMGLPLFRQAAEAAGGKLEITSAPGVGTKVQATFEIDNIDRLPLGDLADTVTCLILTSPQINYAVKYAVEDREYLFDTETVKKLLDGVPIDSLEIIAYLKELISDNIKEVNGGISL